MGRVLTKFTVMVMAPSTTAEVAAPPTPLQAAVCSRRVELDTITKRYGVVVPFDCGGVFV